MVAIPVVLGTRPTARLRPVRTSASARSRSVRRAAPWLAVVAALVALGMVVSVAAAADAVVVAERTDLLRMQTAAVVEVDRLAASLAALTDEVSGARQAVAGLESSLQSSEGFLP